MTLSTELEQIAQTIGTHLGRISAKNPEISLYIPDFHSRSGKDLFDVAAAGFSGITKLPAIGSDELTRFEDMLRDEMFRTFLELTSDDFNRTKPYVIAELAQYSEDRTRIAGSNQIVGVALSSECDRTAYSLGAAVRSLNLDRLEDGRIPARTDQAHAHKGALLPFSFRILGAEGDDKEYSALEFDPFRDRQYDIGHDSTHAAYAYLSTGAAATLFEDTDPVPVPGEGN